MTQLKRVLVSLPHDIEAQINELKTSPEFRKVPTSRILCGLIRTGLAVRQAVGKEDGYGPANRTGQ